ncbi:Alkaline ceramidase 3 [Cyphellophora attinorum]|uniref:Alkaline ceramidase 3 n=1 Tax=Cyphellophora attinorum TaxID=1664694 RepID=A0A0N0NMV8_9EURO|nr:Alkaline ceramidase 3 [Phialophora attinorum]KPI40798.1 Alkaline ceramidase 3 [Phialophora attinorum]
MSSMLSWPYPSGALSGYWRPVTSTINWCEEDYYATPYSAELINSLTNLWFIYLAQRGIRNCLSQRHDRIFLWAFSSYLMIGVGSFIFHSTLKYPMQLLDELSMIYTTCILFFATFEHGLEGRNRVLLGVLVGGIAIFVTGYYHYLGDPVFHQNVFAFLTAVVFFRSLWKMEKTLRPSRRMSVQGVSAAEQARRDRRDGDILRAMWKMIPFGLLSVASGFLVWNLDNIYCDDLRRWRRAVGLPWGILLEGHGWWHLLTGVAEYFNIVWSIWLRHCLDGRQDEVELRWPTMLSSMPEVVRKSSHAKIKQR